MAIPVLPLYLREAGLSYTSVTTVVAAAGAGALIAQLPLGALVPRMSERTVMVVAHVILGVSAAFLGVVVATTALISLRAVSGIGSTAWLLSRHTYLTTTADVESRGRASSAFGGTIRVATMIGPLVGGWVAATHGFTTAFVVIGACAFAGLIPYLMAGSVGETTRTRRPMRIREVIRARWRGLAQAGTIQFGFIMVRIGRFALLPFLGAAVGMDVAEVGLLIAVGSAAELPFVPVAGWLSDRFGRVAAISPSLIGLAIGLVLAGLADTATDAHRGGDRHRRGQRPRRRQHAHARLRPRPSRRTDRIPLRPRPHARGRPRRRPPSRWLDRRRPRPHMERHGPGSGRRPHGRVHGSGLSATRESVPLPTWGRSGSLGSTRTCGGRNGHGQHEPR